MSVDPATLEAAITARIAELTHVLATHDSWSNAAGAVGGEIEGLEWVMERIKVAGGKPLVVANTDGVKA
jgi:hypothetical protein